MVLPKIKTLIANLQIYQIYQILQIFTKNRLEKTSINNLN